MNDSAAKEARSHVSGHFEYHRGPGLICSTSIEDLPSAAISTLVTQGPSGEPSGQMLTKLLALPFRSVTATTAT